MGQDEQYIRPQTPDSPVSVRSNLNLPFDIRANAEALTMYLLNRGMIESIRATGADESVWFGIGVGIMGAIATVLIPFYAGGYTQAVGKLIWFLWSVGILSALLTFYCGIKWKDKRQKSQQAFNKVLEESKTVVSFPSQL